jgi:hypothetical protein
LKVFVEGLYSLLSDLDPTREAVAHLRRAAQTDEATVRRIFDTLLNFVTQTRAGWSHGCNATAFETMIDGVARYLALERVRLRLHTRIQSAANAALGRGDFARPLTGADLTAAFGHTVRDVVAEFCGMEIHSASDAVAVRVGARELIIR